MPRREDRTRRAAAVLATLGHPTRLQIYQFLRGQGASGANVTAILAAVRVPGSTLSHHLDRMRRVGLISALRQERFVYYSVSADLEPAVCALLDPLLHSDG